MMFGLEGWVKTEMDHFYDHRGSLSVAELGKHFDFQVERIFYLTNVTQDEMRGDHAHLDLKQFVICVAGSFKIELDDTSKIEVIEMSNNGCGLFIDGLVWRKMWDFSADAVMLVLCDRVYSQDKVIRDYTEFKKLKNR